MYGRLKTDILPMLVPSDSRILVAVSGGPDSVALFHILNRYAKEEGQHISLVISHIHHGVRKESDQEEVLVKKIAAEFNAEISVHRFKAKEYADNANKSFQEAAREWRYARFREDQEKYGCDLIATAHHMGDQAETVMYRLLRGSGTAGLGGIYPFTSGIIRPLLTVSKRELLEYCNIEGLSFAIDQSNFEKIYARNRIRLELLPLLEKNYNSRIEEALSRTAELLRWDEDYIQKQVLLLWEKYCCQPELNKTVVSYEAWLEPEAILSRIFRLAAKKVSGDPRGLEYKFIKILMEEGRQKGWQQDLPGIKVFGEEEGLAFYSAKLWIEQNNKEIKSRVFIEKDKDGQEVELVKNSWICNEALGVKVLLSDKNSEEQGESAYAVLDGNAISALEYPLVCRARKEGDRMFFMRIGNKSIKKVFQEHNIAAEERKRIPMIVSGSQVIWIPGICRSDSLLPRNTADEKWVYVVS